MDTGLRRYDGVKKNRLGDFYKEQLILRKKYFIPCILSVFLIEFNLKPSGIVVSGP